MIGALRNQIALLERQERPDGAGGNEPDWQERLTLWALVERLSTAPGEPRERPRRRRRIAATIRERTDIAPGDRLRFGAADYEIVSIEGVIDDARRMTLQAEEVRP